MISARRVSSSSGVMNCLYRKPSGRRSLLPNNSPCFMSWKVLLFRTAFETLRNHCDLVHGPRVLAVASRSVVAASYGVEGFLIHSSEGQSRGGARGGNQAKVFTFRAEHLNAKAAAVVKTAGRIDRKAIHSTFGFCKRPAILQSVVGLDIVGDDAGLTACRVERLLIRAEHNAVSVFHIIRRTGQFAVRAEIEHRSAGGLRDPHAAFPVGHYIAQPLEWFSFEIIGKDFSFGSQKTYSGWRVSLDINDTPPGINSNSTGLVRVVQVKSDLSVLIDSADRAGLALFRQQKRAV